MLARKKWNEIYATESHADSELKPKAANVLQDHAYLLPSSGTALDLACGLGGNAMFLAKCGLNTHAWDISAKAIERVQVHCKRNNISLTTEIRDIEQHPPVSNSFDVICVSYYLAEKINARYYCGIKAYGFIVLSNIYK